MSTVITPDHIRQFKEEGFFILEKVISPEDLASLRSECGKFIKEFDDEYAAHMAKQSEGLNKNVPTIDKELDDACKHIASIKLPFTLENVQVIRPKTSASELLSLPSIRALPKGLYELNNSIGISHPGKRYFISFKFLESEAMRHFIFGNVMQQICENTIGKDARLFLEQFVVKGPEVGMKFGWHQDSGYVPFKHNPYVTCWCALDDMSEENGTIYVTSFSKDPESKKGVLPHHKEPGTNDMMCYNSNTPLTQGIPMNVPAGSIVVFSSLIPHSSGANKTDRMRRAYIVQYSDGAVNAQGIEGVTGPRHFDDPVFP